MVETKDDWQSQELKDAFRYMCAKVEKDIKVFKDKTPEKAAPEVSCPSDRTAMWLLRKLEGYDRVLDDHDVVICVWQELVQLRSQLKYLGAAQSQDASPSVERT